MDKIMWGSAVFLLLFKSSYVVGDVKKDTATTEDDGSGWFPTSSYLNETSSALPFIPESPNVAGIAIGITFGIAAVIIILTYLYVAYWKKPSAIRVPTFDNPITFTEDSAL